VPKSSCVRLHLQEKGRKDEVGILGFYRLLLLFYEPDGIYEFYPDIDSAVDRFTVPSCY
jgi:hypothetical protein